MKRDAGNITDPSSDEHYFYETLEDVPSIVLRLGPNGAVEYANPALLDCLGSKPKEIIGKDAFSGIIAHPNDGVLEHLKNDRDNVIRHEAHYRGAAGSLSWVEWRLTALRDAAGEIRGIVCIGDDVTSQRYARERYRVLFEESKDMIYACTSEGVLTEINPAGVELLGGVDEPSLIGVNIVDFYVSRQDREYYNERIRDNGFVKDLELVMRRRDGTEIFVLETSSAIQNAEGETIELRGIVKDITDRIQAEKLQMQMNIKLTDANRKLRLTQSRLVQQEKLASIGQLAAGVAHEINNPLGFVKSNFGSLQRYIGQMRQYLSEIEDELKRISPDSGTDTIEARRQERQLEFILADIDSIFEESSQGFDRIIAIVRGLRNFSRMDAAGKTAEYDLNSAIQDALVMARNELRYVADIEMSLGEIPRVQCRADEVNQVLLNIIVNAAQAIKDRQYDEHRRITVTTWSADQSVFCSIADEGPGMPDEVQSRIFDPFFTTKEIGSGTGLGLSISYDIIVNRHGGDLSVESEPGKGSTFTIRLPIKASG